MTTNVKPDLKALVCGGRNYTDRKRVWEVLDAVYPHTICHGGATGADALAGQWAQDRGVYCEVYPADWEQHGLRAGPVRNKHMLDSFQPDLVIAFPGGRGTESMVTLARAAHVKVMQIV